MITQHGLQCPECMDRIFSNSRHDFVECRCGGLFIDGGFDYTRWGGRTSPGAIPISRTLKSSPPPHFRTKR